MFKVNFAASVLFTAALVTNGTASAHLGRHHVPTASRTIHSPSHRLSDHHGPHGPGFAHLPARHRRHAHVVMHHLVMHHLVMHHLAPHGAPIHRLALRGARSRFKTAERRGGAPSPAGVQTGGASYYESRHRTATGGRVGVATCAHRTLPFGTRVLVTNLANARAAVLTVNDRGPFVRGRIVDVSTAAAGALGMLHAGIAQVRVRVMGPG